MSVIAKHAIWNGKNFEYKHKPILFSNNTVVKVLSCGFCGTDKHTLEELNVPGLSMGHEILSEIVYLGKSHNVVNGEAIKVGDRVILIPGKNCGECQHCLSHTGKGNLCQHRTAHGWGFYSEEGYFAAGGLSTHIEVMEDAWLVRVPDEVPNDIAVLAEPLAIAVRAVDRALSGTRPDRDLGAVVAARAAVIGLGPIGYLVAYVLKTLGADVVGFDIEESRCDFFKKTLRFPAMTLSKDQPSSIVQTIKKDSPVTEFDLVFECGGTTSAFVASLLAVRKAGRVVELGNYIQEKPAEIDPSWICRKELDILGFVLANPFTYIKVFKLLALNSVDALSIVTKKLPLSRVDDLLTLNHQRQMKVVVENDG